MSDNTEVPQREDAEPPFDIDDLDYDQALESTIHNTDYEVDYILSSSAMISAELAYQQVVEVRDLLFMRRVWSVSLGITLFVEVVAQWGLLYLVGVGECDFNGYGNLLHMVVVTNFASIVGLVLVVVNYLFPKDGRLMARGGPQIGPGQT